MWMHSVQFYKAIQRLVTIVKTEDEILKQLGEANDRKQQWFSRRLGIWRHFWLTQLRERGKGIATGIYWVETRDAAKYPPMHRTGPTTKN